MAEGKKKAVEKAEDIKKTEVAAPVAEEAKAEAKKPAAKRTAVKKTAAKKTTTTRGRKPAVKEVVHVQFEGKSYTTEDLVKSAKDVWRYDLKQKVSDFKSVEIYVKPEENLAYYVINGDVTGSFLI